MSSSPRFKRVCVFCGAKSGNNPHFYSTAGVLGGILASKKIDLVYGGGALGMMEGVSTSAIVKGGKVFGIIPTPLNNPEYIGMTLGKVLPVLTMEERMSNMLSYSDAFIILPGGFGTLTELFQVISWAELNIHKKPIGILNVDGFFDQLFSFLDHAVKMELLSPVARQIFVVADNVNELLDKLEAHQPKIDPDMARLDWSKKQELKLELTLATY